MTLDPEETPDGLGPDAEPWLFDAVRDPGPDLDTELGRLLGAGPAQTEEPVAFQPVPPSGYAIDLDQVAMDDVDPYPARDPGLYPHLAPGAPQVPPHRVPVQPVPVQPVPVQAVPVQPLPLPPSPSQPTPPPAVPRTPAERQPVARGARESAPGPEPRPGMPGRVRRLVRAIARRGVAVLFLQLVAIGYLTGIASLLFWSHAPELIGWHPRVVLTGSMMPVIQPGDVSVIGPAVVGPTSLPRGRVVLVKDEQMRSGFYLHRVVRYDPQGRIITKGDANRSEDSTPVLAMQIMGQLRLVVPIVGRPVVWLQNAQYLPVALAGLGTWAALAVVAGVGVGRRGRASTNDRSRA